MSDERAVDVIAHNARKNNVKVLCDLIDEKVRLGTMAQEDKVILDCLLNDYSSCEDPARAASILETIGKRFSMWQSREIEQPIKPVIIKTHAPESGWKKVGDTWKHLDDFKNGSGGNGHTASGQDQELKGNRIKPLGL